MQSVDVERAREVVLAHGWNSTCYQILNTGFRHWFAPGEEAVVGFVDHGQYRIVGGAPICAEDRLPSVVEQFERDCIEADRHVCYFCAEARLRSVLDRGPGYASVVLGAQPVWNPGEWSHRVQDHASLRAQFNRARNKHVEVQEWSPSVAENHPELRRCLREWLGSRGLPPLHFLVEPDTLSMLRDRRCFVARRDGDVIAFLIASPIPRRNGWLIEQLVRGEGAVNGTAELLLDTAIRSFVASGHTYVTLGLAPLARTFAPHSHTPLWLRVLLAWARAHGKRFYNFEGLESFKAKFQPERWDPVYLVTNEAHVSVSAVRATAAAFARGSPERVLARAVAQAAREELHRLIKR